MKPLPPKNHQGVNTIIHTAAVAAASVGAGLAQVPGSDTAVIIPIQVTMIIAIGDVYERELSHSSAAATLTSISASFVGRGASQLLIGWLPGLGNVINATTAFSITEAVGWGVNDLFRQDHEDFIKRNRC